jgi:uncharacterized protein YqfB (UPF0267 family)
LAQDLEKIVPELVKNTQHVLFDENGNSTGKIEIKAVETIQLVPLLIKAVQEQQIMIEELKKEIDKLKQEK